MGAAPQAIRPMNKARSTSSAIPLHTRYFEKICVLHFWSRLGIHLMSSPLTDLRWRESDRGEGGGLVFADRLARRREGAFRALVAGFVVFGILVDAPGVVDPLAGDDVLDRQHRGHHRVVLVVVTV